MMLGGAGWTGTGTGRAVNVTGSDSTDTTGRWRLVAAVSEEEKRRRCDSAGTLRLLLLPHAGSALRGLERRDAPEPHLQDGR